MKNHLVAITGCLCLSLMASSLQAGKLVEKSSKGWKYSDKKEAPAKEWNQVEFDDSEWSDGQAPLGYGDDDIKTKVSFGDDPENKNLSVVFRKTFEVEDASAIAGIAGKLVVDDAAVVFINGKEVYRINLPKKEEIKETTPAIIYKGGEMERIDHKFAVASDKLKTGKNVVAIRVHQHNAASSDLAVDVELESIKEKEDFQAKAKEAEEEDKIATEQIELAAEQIELGGF